MDNFVLGNPELELFFLISTPLLMLILIARNMGERWAARNNIDLSDPQGLIANIVSVLVYNVWKWSAADFILVTAFWLYVLVRHIG